MKTLCSAVPLVLTAFLLLAGCSGRGLTEERAKSTVEALLAKGQQLPDNCCPPATLLEWRGLILSSEGEMQAKAVIQHHDGKMSGAFIFHKTASGEWVLDKVAFTDSRMSWWNAEVFQKVE